MIKPTKPLDRLLARWEFPVGSNTAVLGFIGREKVERSDYEAVLEVVDLMKRQMERRDGFAWFPEI